MSTQGVQCFNTSAYTSNLHWIAFYLEISTSTWEAAAGSLPAAIREKAAGSQHLTSKQSLVLLLYGKTIRPTSIARHVKENTFWFDCLVGCCLRWCLFLLWQKRFCNYFRPSCPSNGHRNDTGNNKTDSNSVWSCPTLVTTKEVRMDPHTPSTHPTPPPRINFVSFHYTGTIYFPRAPLPAREKMLLCPTNKSNSKRNTNIETSANNNTCMTFLSLLLRASWRTGAPKRSDGSDPGVL